MKKFGILLLITVLLVGLIPGIAMATAYNNDVPSGLTLLGWSVNPDQGGQHTAIDFLYTGGFRAPMGINAPFNSSWHLLDDVRPILLAEQEGFGNYLGGTNGSFGSNIKFSDDVLAAMKVQNFNPSQVGGANIPPSSTTLNSTQIAWLQKIGYSVKTTSSTTTTTSAPASVSNTTPAQPSSIQQAHIQSQPQPSQQTTSSTQSNAAALTTTDTQQSKTQPPSTSASSNPAVGTKAKSPSGPMTNNMVAADQKLVQEHPPTLNPKNIPNPIVSKKPVQTSNTNLWIGLAAGVILLAAGVITGRKIYLKHRVV